MNIEDDEVMFSMGGGCLAHGDEHMLECSMCGMEFCTKCFPDSVVCEECAAEPEGHLLDEDLHEDNRAEDDDLLSGIDGLDEQDPEDPDEDRR